MYRLAAVNVIKSWYYLGASWDFADRLHSEWQKNYTARETSTALDVTFVYNICRKKYLFTENGSHTMAVLVIIEPTHIT